MDALLGFLDAHHVAHLATAGDGGPHAAPLFYARLPGGPAITWISAPHVLHSRHLGASPEAAVSVAPSTPSLGLIEGVQLRGHASAPAGEQAALAGAWLSRFPEARAMVEAAGDHVFWVLRPTWARLVRTERGVGMSREWSF